MNFSNRNFVRGLFLVVFALVFGGAAARYPLGNFARFGPGLFPLLISGCLLLIGLITVVRARLVEPVPLNYNFKNILIIMVALCGFVAVSHFLNMLLGIVFLVFSSTLAGTSYSWVRNVKISVGLIAVAFAFKHLLGLSLPIL
ncbi:tripartite tricarboxylate transporter TctB family protein [Bordetella sp. N]|uniref:tripartite tricarboxylate transporter TctB family protein n=1 Tax=Bordetella sp. N TaxID=1746199 RepID=UPI00070A96C1|nr:tripartite tricarboxylate transporter TctB family protein [Bordetella sp. N]ALM81723.1 tripartite tricarboxylate transporter TctB [Bordetella sp. N]